MSWLHLSRPYWLVLLPLMAWLLWRLWHHQRRAGQWQKLLPAHLHALLLTRGRPRRSKLPWLLLGLAWLVALLALLGPAWDRLEQPTHRRIDPLVVLLEVTPAMLAGDVTPNRLEMGKRKLLDYLETRRDAQTAVIVYAGSAHTLVPLSDDLATIRNLLGAVDPSIMPVSGQRADLAVSEALELLAQGGLGRGRLLLIGSGLSPEERSSIARQLRRSGDSLSILGVGTSRGAPIMSPDGSFLKDPQGAILLPRLDRPALAEAAAEFGGSYQTARLGDEDLAALGLLQRQGSWEQEPEQIPLAAWRDRGHWLLLPLLIIAALAGRRGWLFCMALMILPTQQGHALEWQDLWLTPDQQGQRLYRAERFDEASSRFRDRPWQAMAAYQAGDYHAAAERFGEIDSPTAHYNRGNALALAEQLEAALEAYDQALHLDPGLEQARHNRALVEQWLRQQQEQEQQARQEATDDESAKPASDAGQSRNADDMAASEPAQEPGADPGAQPSEPSQVTQPHPTELEARQEAEQWLRRIPDDPSELLRQKFLLEQRRRQGGV
ncbi:VWA domain-containing protein [Stutzerimonas tarimensis]|uniref:VWA domain-containing protein n=1 Tax=Stutzerimonas tarimensis TaxID=1507735 RepID=A0ABV7T6F6_9GAMM